MAAGHFVTSISFGLSGNLNGQAMDGYPEPIVTHLQNPVNSFLAGDYPLFILVKPVVERHGDKEKERRRDPALFLIPIRQPARGSEFPAMHIEASPLFILHPSFSILHIFHDFPIVQTDDTGRAGGNIGIVGDDALFTHVSYLHSH